MTPTIASNHLPAVAFPVYLLRMLTKWKSSSRRARPLALVLTLAAIALPFAPARAGVNRWTGGGPNAGWPEQIAIAPSKPSVIYAAVHNGRGIFKSTDGGASWRNVSGPTFVKQGIQAVIVDPDNPARAWISVGNFGHPGQDSGLFRTTNGGTSWTKLDDPSAPASAESLAVDPTNGNIIYAGGFGQIWKSINGGNTWTDFSTGLPSWNVYTIAVDPRANNTLYAGIQVSGLYQKVGSGSWTQVAAPGISVIDVVVGPGSTPGGSAAIAAVFNGGVIKFENGTETQLDDVDDVTNTARVSAVAAHPTNPDVLYTGFDEGFGGFFKTADGGDDWVAQDLGYHPLQLITDIAVNPNNPSTVYVATRGAGIYKTTNGGADWAGANKGLKASIGNDVASNPNNGKVAYIATNGGGVFKTTDAGRTWVRRSTGLYRLGVNVLAIDPSNPQTIYAGLFAGWVHKSTDGGAHWTMEDDGMGGASVVGLLVVAPSDPQTLYSGGEGMSLFKSVDGADNWTSFAPGGLTGFFISSLAVDPEDSDRLFAITSDGLFTSDNEEAWTELNTGLPVNNQIVTFGQSPSNPDVTYAAVGDPDAGDIKIFENRDGFAADGWSPTGFASLAQPTDIDVDPNNPNIVYLTINGKIRRSNDGGETFSSMDTGLGPRFVNSLDVNDDSINFYAATAGSGGMHYLRDTVQPPRPTMTKPATMLQTDRRIGLAWQSSDAQSGVDSHWVRYRRAPIGGSFGPLRIWRKGIEGRNATFVGDRGNTYCFSVRTKDNAGLLSRWSNEKCARILRG